MDYFLEQNNVFQCCEWDGNGCFFSPDRQDRRPTVATETATAILRHSRGPDYGTNRIRAYRHRSPKVHCHLHTSDTNPSSPLCIASVPPTPEQEPSIQSPGNELRHVHESISRSSALPLPPAPPPIQTVRPIQLQRIRDAENERWLSGQHDSDRCGEGT